MLTSSTTVTSSLETYHETSYGDLIVKPYRKVLRNNFVKLTTYVFTQVPTVSSVPIIVSILRLLQLFLPSLTIPRSDLWEPGTGITRTMNFISTVPFFISPNSMSKGSGTHLIIFSSLNVLYIALMLAGVYFYERKAYLHIMYSRALSYATLIYGYIGPNAIMFNAGYWFSTSMFLSILSVILSVPVIWISSSVSLQTLTFRRIPQATYMILPQQILSTIIPSVNLLLGYLSRIPNNYSAILSLFLYAILFWLPFLTGGFIKRMDSVLIVASTATCIVSLLITCYLSIVGMYFPTLGVFALVVFFVMMALIFSRVNKSRLMKHLMILDTDPTLALKSVNKFCSVVCSGFSVGHPTILDFSFIRTGCDTFKRRPEPWFLLARFSSVYPEAANYLSSAYHSTVDLHLSGQYARCIKQQAPVVARRREANLSVDLKYRLSSLQRHIHSSKARLGRVWDVAIQGNIYEVEVSTRSFFIEVRKVDASFEHLFRQYPNNRFITRAYSKFLSEVAIDPKAAFEYSEKTNQLQRGMSIVADQVHAFALETFPMLPEKLTAQSYPVQVDDDVETAIKPSEGSDRLSMLLEKLRIPAIKTTRLIRISALLLSLALLVFLLIYSTRKSESLAAPLNSVVELARLRTLNAQCFTFSNRYIYHSLGAYYDPDPLPNINANVTWKPHDHLIFALTELSKVLQNVEEFLKFESSDEYMHKAQDLMFQPTFEKLTYTTGGTILRNKVSIRIAMNDYYVRFARLIDEDEVISLDDETIQAIINPLLNTYNISSSITEVIEYIRMYIRETDANTKKSILILTSSLAAFIGVVFLTGGFYQAYLLKTSKYEAHSTLTLLPKGALSTLVQVSRDDEEGVTRRDEAAVRALAAGTGNSSTTSDNIIMWILVIASMALTIAGFVVVYNVVVNSAELVVTTSPRLDGMFGAYSYGLQALGFLNTHALKGTSYYPGDMDLIHSFDESYLMSNQKWKIMVENYRALQEEVLDLQNCDSRTIPPVNMNEGQRCFYVDALFQFGMISLQEAHDADLPSTSGVYARLHDTFYFPLYSAFFSRVFDITLPEFNDSLSTLVSSSYPLIFSLMGLVLISEIIALIRVNQIEQHIRNVLHLLMGVSADAVLSSQKVMSVLTGKGMKGYDYSESVRPKEFYDRVFESLVDPVLCADPSGTIVISNTAANKVFQNSILGKNLSEYISIFKTSQNPNQAFQGSIESFDDTSSSVNRTVSNAGPVRFGREVIDGRVYTVTSTTLGRKIVVTLRDITSIERYNELIESERARSDKLLSAIIPPSLVNRVKAGEQRIGFSVQSASIIFLDIVEFTPWCASLPAAKVMSTLNALFGKLDNLVSNYRTLTRVKGIGDCYMAAGGIFDEINQPSEHAKEAVAFALQAVEAVEDLGAGLRARAGVNTGGPIVAGVLGIGKPTFEIFGEAINLAQQMEHGGVPGAVQISRSVYELIYGEKFNIKEKGTTTVKGKTIQTYIVSQ